MGQLDRAFLGRGLECDTRLAIGGGSPVYVLVPDDAAFLARLREIEDPLMVDLRDYGLTEIYLEQAELIRSAYDAWHNFHQQLPRRSGGRSSLRREPHRTRKGTRCTIREDGS